MNIRYIDAHCHVQFGMYDSDRGELIERMREQGVAGVVVGCDYESSKAALALAEGNEHLYAAVGLHPNHESDEWYDAARYKALAEGAKVVAIGECGLDYFRPAEVNEETKEKQKRLLRDQIAIACELDKPLIIHSRPSRKTQDAYQDLIAILTEAKRTHPNLRGDVHFFVGGIEEMRALVALGFTVSYTAVITFAREYDHPPPARRGRGTTPWPWRMSSPNWPRSVAGTPRPCASRSSPTASVYSGSSTEHGNGDPTPDYYGLN
jgi:TatD DNase family protein